jgi:hypothetical protein
MRGMIRAWRRRHLVHDCVVWISVSSLCKLNLNVSERWSVLAAAGHEHYGFVKLYENSAHGLHQYGVGCKYTSPALLRGRI